VAPESPAVIARLAAEVRRDLSDLERLAGQAAYGQERLATPADFLVVYGVAKVLHDFYLACERLLGHVAAELGGLPVEGAGWHRQLLDDATLEIPNVRPAVLSEAAARLLDPFLRFRHRFRTLYAFDLEAEPLRELLSRLPAAHTAVRQDVERFLAFLDRLLA